MMDVDQDDFSFDDQLLYHIRQKNNEVAQKILKRASNLVSKVDNLGNTLLHYVAHFTNDAMVNYLIDSGAKVDAQNREGQTPLWLAIDAYWQRRDREENKRKTILNLLDANANMHIRDKRRKNPLSRALATITSDLLLQLFEKLNTECSGNSKKIAKKLIKAKCSVFASLYQKNTEVTRILLNSGCPVEPPYLISCVSTTLQACIYKNQVENVKLLLDHGADPNDENEGTPMTVYTYNNRYDGKNPEILQLLLDRGANPTKIVTKTSDHTLYKKMQMCGVLRFGNRESIRILLRSNVDLNARDGDGYTALHYVIENKRSNVFEEFEGRDFDVNARCNRGLTPLLYVATYYSERIGVNLLKFLQRHGADLDAKDQSGKTTLMYLCRFKYIPLYTLSRGGKNVEKVKRCVEYLLQHGADPQVVTPKEKTVLNTQEFDTRVYPPVVDSVLAHLVMLEDLGTPIKQVIRDQIRKNKKYKNTFQTYRKQLKNMKKMKIWKSLTLHELLIGKDSRIERYLREDGLTLKLSRLSNKYTPRSYYCYAVRERISKILYPIKLKKAAVITMTKVTGINFEGYPIIIDKIYNYLTNKDLLNFCRIV